jgi:hypothetical protein
MPIRSTVTPLLVCAPAPELPPKASPARSRPTAIVSTTMPSAKPKSAMPMLGPCRLNGPSDVGPVEVAAPGAAGSTVKVNCRFCSLRLGSVAVEVSWLLQEPTNFTVTVPGWKIPVALFGARSFRKYR